VVYCRLTHHLGGGSALSARAARSATPIAALRYERDRFVALAFSWADVLFELDEKGSIAYCAGAVEAYLERTPEELIGTSMLQLVLPAERDRLRELMANARRRERLDDTVVTFKRPTGGKRPLAVVGYQLPELKGHYFLAARNVHALHLSEDLSRQGRDDVSKLLIGPSFADMVSKHLTEAPRATDESLSFIVLRGYKELQERLVATTEQQLLATLGSCLRRASIDGNGAARLGPDQFGLVHKNAADMARLKDEIAGMTRDADPLNKGVAVATATMSTHTDDLNPHEVARGLRYAITRFGAGRGGDAILKQFSSGISMMVKEAIAASNGLQKVVDQASFTMVFQPIVNSRTGSIHHYEALARFPNSTDFGSPYEYISFAESIGLITDFDLAMARKAVAWLRKEPPQNAHSKVAVNVSGQSINSEHYLAGIDRMIKENPSVQGRLLFEITETSRIGDLVAANEAVQHLRRYGAHVCLDDFGAGAANFGYLANLDVDVVKLDGSAIHNAKMADKGRAFLKALVGLCDELGIVTVAEMIETKEDLAFVRDCGVQFVQGYLFGQPSADIRLFSKTIPADLFRHVDGAAQLAHAYPGT
jgi:PAS domain S-box-containing protein